MDSLSTRSDIRSKTIEATPAEVFAAMSDPLRVARWWGPDGFRSTFHGFECHVGGMWRMTMHAPDGKAFPNDYRVLRWEPNRLMALERVAQEHVFTLTMALASQGNNTLVSWQQTFHQAEEFQPIAGFLAQANEQVLERLRQEVVGTA